MQWEACPGRGEGSLSFSAPSSAGQSGRTQEARAQSCAWRGRMGAPGLLATLPTSHSQDDHVMGTWMRCDGFTTQGPTVGAQTVPYRVHTSVPQTQ